MRVLRNDLVAGNGELAPPQQLPNGSWRIQGYATRAGVFRYLNPDGTERFEFRPPEEVEKSAGGLASCALTNKHPPEGRVTPATAEKHQRGIVLESRWDAETQRVPVDCLVTHQDLLDSLAAGRRELSAGYEATVTEEAGEYEGQRYTHVQRDIVYNHLAAVDAGRAGPKCAFRLDAHGDAQTHADAEDAPPVVIPTSTAAPTSAAKEKPMQKVVINGVEYEVPEALATALMAERAAWEKKLEAAKAGEVEAMEDVKEQQALVVAADTAKTEAIAKVDAADKARQALQVKLDEAKDEVRTLKRERADASSDEAVSKRVAARTALQMQVAPVLGANYDYTAASDEKLRVDALEKVLEGKEPSKKRLAGYVAAKNSSAVTALFEHVMEERADSTSLGATHSPAPGAKVAVDPFMAAQEKLKQDQKGPRAK